MLHILKLRVRSQVTLYDPSLHLPSNAAIHVEAEMFGHCLYQQHARLELTQIHTVPWFISYTYTHLVWLLEVILVDYHHYFNTYKPVITMFYVVGHLARAVFTCVHSQNFSLTNTLSASDFIQSMYCVLIRISYFPHKTLRAWFKTVYLTKFTSKNKGLYR